jgi:putative DNA primase/helicase
LYAKLIFSTNKIPETEDESDAYFRREIILSFPNRFEDGKGADPNLLNKLTTEEELSGIFNVLAIALRTLLRISL